jgi:hypothetical protein
MSHARAERVELARRRENVADLYIQGWTQTAIAKQVGVSQGTISTDLKAIQKAWCESAVRNFDTLRERELKKLDRLEREAWAAWERSQKPAQSAVIHSDGNGQKTQKRVAEQCGDPRYLEQVHKCIVSRRALLGLDAPTKIAPTSPDGDTAYHSHVMAELMKLAEGSKSSPDVIDCEVVERMLLEGPDGGQHDHAAEG